jgi:glutamate carboxypeptidase
MEISDFDVYLPNMLVLLQRLVEAESPTHNKAAVDRVGTLITEECYRLGARVKVHSQSAVGNHLEARWGKGSRGILLLAHMDTVFPLGTLENMPFITRDKRTFGPGVSDMKGGIVVGLTAMDALLESGQMPPRPITALFTSDEETGSTSSRLLIENLAKNACLVLVLEPGLQDLSLKTSRKGVGEFKVRVRGKAAHAGGNHENGRNAIEEMAHQVLAIQKLTDYSRDTTLNVGVIHGGIASNVVPAEAYIEIDLRVMQPGEAKRIMDALYSLKPVLEGTSIEVTGDLNRPPMPFDDAMQLTFSKARTLAAKVGMKLKGSGTGGASDANFIARLGVPVLDGLGPAGGEYHSEREFIYTASLLERLKLLFFLLRDWEN